MYVSLQESAWQKISRSIYLIISISLLTHTTSIVYSLLTFKQQSSGFLSIIVSAMTCFFISSSHLTIYGISILGSLYIAMLLPYYPRHQLYYIVAMSGVIMFIFWKSIHAAATIFRCLPGRVHASMVFGIALIVLSKFFPLAIQNVDAFFNVAQQSTLMSPLAFLEQIFQDFNVLTLGLTFGCIICLFLIRQKLQKMPLIGMLVVVGIVVNISHNFKSYADLCSFENVNCSFYIINISNLKAPLLQELFEVLPAAIVMTIVLIFQQFLYLEEFARRGKMRDQVSSQTSNSVLGEVATESKTLAIANLVSGCLGGLPICINLFGTYENVAFNNKNNQKATKWVGVLQIPFSYCLYSFLSYLFNMIPLFVLFAVVATPMVYFLNNVLALHRSHLVLVVVLAALNVFTHPLLALIVACLFSIYDIAELLRPAPSELILQGVDFQGKELDPSKQRRSSIMAKVPQKQGSGPMSQFVSRIIEIQDDTPKQLENKKYILYRFVGSLTFLNCFQHLEEIIELSDKCANQQTILVLSFRYVQVVDEESLRQLALTSSGLRNNGRNIIFTGLYPKILKNMEAIPEFKNFLQAEQNCMYCLQV